VKDCLRALRRAQPGSAGTLATPTWSRSLHVQDRALVRLGRVREAMAAFDEAILWQMPGASRRDPPPARGLARVGRGGQAGGRAAGSRRRQLRNRRGVRPAGRGLPGLGDFPAAEDAYQQASRWGRQPQPGLALLRLAQGKTDTAAAAIARAVTETTDRLGRAKLLPAQVEIMLAVGDVRAARDAAAELAEIAESYDTRALRAVADHARGAVLLTEGDARGAVVALRGAWQAWRELEAPYEAARVRMLVGVGCRALGDEEGTRRGSSCPC
jgi:tetratricopeptide (TPR) repeat protein